MGLTGVGLAGLILSYAGIAHTFIDGMHALTGLLFMFGLIIMTAGLLEGGISTSNRTKATVLTIISKFIPSILRLKSSWKITKCPELDIGKGSENPWIIPRNIYFSNNNKLICEITVYKKYYL